MSFVRIRVAIALIASASMLVACDAVSQVKDGIAHATAASESIEKQVGTKPQIGFNYNNSAFSQATVQFSSVPAMPLPELEKVVRAAVVAEFKDEPVRLVIAFTYTKAP